MIGFMIGLILSATIPTFLFIHFNYKKYSILSIMNEFMMFKKMLFNKRSSNCSGKKIVLSFFFLTVSLMSLAYRLLYVLIVYYAGNLIGIMWYILFVFLILLFIILILRLVYELVVIPISKYINKYNASSTVVSPDDSTQYYQNISNEQLNYKMNERNQPQQSAEIPISIETQNIFCSQCGTCYSISDEKCPNCGMK